MGYTKTGSDEIRPIDPKVLARTLGVASSRNQQSGYNFAVVSDLSTVVQIGDLFEISFRPSGEENLGNPRIERRKD